MATSTSTRGLLLLGAAAAAIGALRFAWLAPGDPRPWFGSEVAATASDAEPLVATSSTCSPANAPAPLQQAAPDLSSIRIEPAADREIREFVQAVMLDQEGRHDSKPPRDPLRSTRLALDDRRINPDGRQLNDEQLQQFRILVQQHAQRVAVAAARATALRDHSMLRSLRAGRFTTRAAESTKNGYIRLSDGLEEAIAASGIPRQDLRCSVSTFAAPDGVIRNVVTYMTRQGEPDYFFAAELVEQLRQQQERELRAFVASLP